MYANSFSTQPFGSTDALLLNFTVALPVFISTRWIFPSTSTSTGIANGILFGVSHFRESTFSFVAVTSFGSFGWRR